MTKKLADVSEKDWRALLGLNKSSKFKRNKKSRAHSQPAIVDDSARLDFSNMEDNRRSFKRRAIPFSDMVGNKRGKFGDQLSENSQASETVYRILCHSRKIGSVIGKGSGVVKALREETQVKITVVDSVPGSEEMVIVVYSFSTKNPVTQNTDMELQCAAQDALLKVHDRIVEEESGTGNETVVTARLLVPNNTVGCLLGKNGDVIKRLQSQTGASIHVLPADQLPVCAMSTDELVQISAKQAIARRALCEVSTLLHQNPRKDKPPSGFPIHPLMSNLPPTANQMWPERSSSARGGWRGEYEHSRFGPADFDGDRVVSHDREAPAEFSMKILCPAAKIGGVIGKGGSIVRQVQQETGTDIHGDDVSGDSDERVIHVSAFELLVGKFKGVARSRLGLKYRLMKKKKSNKTRFRAKKKSQIYLDGSFLFHCYIHKMNIRNMKYKGMKFEIVVTDCTWKELLCYVNQFTEHSIKSIYDSMRDRVSTKNCGHKDSMHAQDCIMSRVGENKNKALIASHDSCFLQKLSENPLIPVVVIEGGNFAFKCLSKNHRREYLFFREPGDDPDEERLMDRMKLFEFEHVKVKGDGNCLLRALSEQITHVEHNHGIVRKLLSGQIEQNEELYKEDAQKFMRHHQEFELHTYSDFVEYFSKVDALAPLFITVQAASDFFKAKIVCISSEEKAVFREFAPHDVDDPKIVWYLSLLVTEDGHADSVYPQRTPSEYCRHLYDLNTLPMVTEEDSS